MGFWYTLIGVAFSFSSEIWVGWGNIQVKYSHKIDAESDDPQPVYKRGRWWFGVILYVMNMVFSLISYMFASINVLAPTSALTIIINAILANIYFGEKLSCNGVIGSFLIMVGCVISILFGSHEQDDIVISDLIVKAEDRHFIIYSILDIGIIMSCVVISTKMHSHHISETEMEIKMGIGTNDNNNNNNNRQRAHFRSNANTTRNNNRNNSRNTNKNKNTHNNDNANDETEIENLVPISPIGDSNSHDNGNNREVSVSSVDSESLRHGLRAVLMCFAAAGVAGWVQIFGKICADLIFDTLTGNNQFDSIIAWLVLAVSASFIFIELYMISEMMRIFDAVLAIPLFNSFQILSSIMLSEEYFDDFANYTIWQEAIFALGLLGIIIGIVFVTIGQNSVSMKNHNSDQMKYIATKHQIIEKGDEIDSHLKNLSLSDINRGNININISIDNDKLNKSNNNSSNGNNSNQNNNNANDSGSGPNSNSNSKHGKQCNCSLSSHSKIVEEESDSEFDERAKLL